MPSITEKRRTFRSMHEQGCFVIPNPWDIGSARYLQHLGFKALATTSLGYAYAAGYADGEVPRGLMLDHIAELVEATDLPVNADFESGFADTPEGVAANVQRALETGIAGLSIEDQAGPGSLYPLDMAVARIQAARAAIDASGTGALLVARTEAYLNEIKDVAFAIERLKAFSEAGADCLFAPGMTDAAEIAETVKAVAPKPVNVLIMNPDMRVADLAALGVRRVSVGGALAAAAWRGFDAAAAALAEQLA